MLSTENRLIDAILDARESDALQLADHLLQSGIPRTGIESLCTEAMQVLGRQFRPDPLCIDHLVTADLIISGILDAIQLDQ